MNSLQAATSDFYITHSIYVAAVAAVVLVPLTFFLRTFSARRRPPRYSLTASTTLADRPFRRTRLHNDEGCSIPNLSYAQGMDGNLGLGKAPLKPKTALSGPPTYLISRNRPLLTS
jgi:hypothetical protein